MRISALAPMFVTETPEDPKGEAAKVLAFAADRRAQVQAASKGSESKRSADEETRAGLKRLSQLIRDRSAGKQAGADSQDSGESRREDPGKKPAGKSAGGTSKTSVIYPTASQRAIASYESVLKAGKSENTFGQFLDLAV